ncbi:signal peptidase II [Pedomonas mirosovicensis]|uniref:signal peptidase II n=1 Tax=Pedomonas mirosovicensis TaxID=2908641 RepID=UPI002168A6D6|nr:signal peptidase II [Pedomonas mirosovicensis]MCH8684600.1 signal peptidase II [Pedomonas mirosovicensis]
MRPDPAFPGWPRSSGEDVPPRATHRLLGYAFAAVVLVADQVSKWWILEVFRLPEKISVPIVNGFLHLTMVWNRGVSTGLLTAKSDMGRWLLIALTAAISIFVAVWLWRERSRWQAVALGGILGGAIGNIIDRTRFGAVADFIDVKGIPYWSYVFNVADAAITIGVAIILLLSLRKQEQNNRVESAE